MWLANGSLVRGWIFVLFALGAGCTGKIGDVGQNGPHGSGSGTGTGGPATGSGGSGPGVPDSIGWSTRFPRLSHPQWESTVQDLFRLAAPSGLSKAFSPDPTTRFDTNVEQRKVSSNLWLDYQTAAEAMAKQIVSDPAKLAKILPPNPPADVVERGRAFLTDFGTRAFRRPLTQAELDAYLAVFQKGAQLIGGDPFTSGMELLIRAILQSPQFIYRIEGSTQVTDGKIPLSGYEVASRLSYALWNTMPSDPLFAAAASGELDVPAGVEKWARTMLDDPRAAQTILGFHEQLFHVSSYGTVAKDPAKFPTFTPDLEPLLQQEAHLFFDDVANQRGGGIAELLTRPVTFVNDRTAPFYGLAATYGPTMTRVDLDGAKRAGILTQIGFLSKNGGLTQSDPIHRGVLINFNLLCIELNPPPNGVPPLPAQQPGQTNRQRIEAHTNTCGKGCHDVVINPIGFAFEHYDAIGAWRDQDNGQPIDAKATYLLDGQPVTYDGALELSALLAKSPTVHQCYASNWLEYALGRAPVAGEANAVKTVADASALGASATELLAKITALDAFRARPPEN
jgi:hypothetical protein